MNYEQTKLVNFLPLLPKIELRRHLIGSIRVVTLLDIASRYDISLPTKNLKPL